MTFAERFIEAADTIVGLLSPLPHYFVQSILNRRFSRVLWYSLILQSIDFAGVIIYAPRKVLYLRDLLKKQRSLEMGFSGFFALLFYFQCSWLGVINRHSGGGGLVLWFVCIAGELGVQGG